MSFLLEDVKIFSVPQHHLKIIVSTFRLLV